MQLGCRASVGDASGVKGQTFCDSIGQVSEDALAVEWHVSCLFLGSYSVTMKSKKSVLYFQG